MMLPRLSFLVVAVVALLGRPFDSQAQSLDKASQSSSSSSLAPGELFAGEWEWATGGEVFHLTLTRNPSYVFPEYPNDPPRNVVIGHFVYTRNGTVVDRSLTTGGNPFAAFGGPANNRSMEMQFYDHGTNGYGALTVSFQANNSNVLNWVLIPEETAYRNPADRPAVPFLVPTTMTLTRQ